MMLCVLTALSAGHNARLRARKIERVYSGGIQGDVSGSPDDDGTASNWMSPVSL